MAIGESDVEVISRIDNEVSPAILAELNTLPEFTEAYVEGAQSCKDFDSYKLIHSVTADFLTGYDEFVRIVREFFFK